MPDSNYAKLSYRYNSIISDKNKIGSSSVNKLNWIGIKALPNLPFPSRYACIVSNWEWDYAKLSYRYNEIYNVFVGKDMS